MRLLLSFFCLILPIAAQGADTHLTLNGVSFNVELAVTQQERSRGLMGRKFLAENSGMLFVYDTPGTISFWMKNMFIPLDILFFDREGRLQEIIPNIQPCRKTPCKTYTNKNPAQFVLELPAGSAKKYNITVGNHFKTSHQ